MTNTEGTNQIHTFLKICTNFYSGGLQVLFIGDVPQITFYDKQENIESEHDVSKMSAGEIKTLLVENGCIYADGNKGDL